MVEMRETRGWWPSVLDPLRKAGERVAEWVAPRSEAATNGDSYEITLELPGVSIDDIDISVHDGAMTVQGEKRAERTEEGKTWFFTEREYGAFQRTFRLPADADQSKISASFKDGVLTLKIDKRGEAIPSGRKIAIDKG